MSLNLELQFLLTDRLLKIPYNKTVPGLYVNSSVVCDEVIHGLGTNIYTKQNETLRGLTYSIGNGFNY